GAIYKNYQFIVSSGYYSHLLEATYFDDANDRVTFKDVGLGTSFKVTAAQAGTGTFYLDGYAYSFTADYTGGSANFTSFGTDTAGVIWTPSEANVRISNNATHGFVDFSEYRKGPGDGAAADVKHVNVTITDAGAATTDKITCNTPTIDGSTTLFGYDFLPSWDSKNNYYDGYTRWGTYVEYETPTGGQNPVTITYPIAEAIADVYLTSGVVSTTAAGGEVGGLVQVDVGSAVLDTEVADWEAQNVIVVGGPCVNRVAAALMGLPYPSDECAAGFEEGKAKIKLFEDENVALLVAGYSATDTRRACTVMKNYKDYAADLVGTEVEMTATSDADIVLAAPVVE
ncbi:MAG: hypothetical protein KKF74_05325, partial [Nanoarchaeota archaeon]|nr:hypothetical protein [Nanoarchaeota archaeon]